MTNSGNPRRLLREGDQGTGQVGYTVVEPSWGHGYATEALRVLLSHVLAEPGVQRAGVEDGESVDLVVTEAVAGTTHTH